MHLIKLHVILTLSSITPSYITNNCQLVGDVVWPLHMTTLVPRKQRYSKCQDVYICDEELNILAWKIKGLTSSVSASGLQNISLQQPPVVSLAWLTCDHIK